MNAQHVKVIPATRAIKPSSKVAYVACFGVKVEHSGDSCDCAGCADRQSWEGYIYSHPALSESGDVYESAEDCAVAALRVLAQRLASDVEGVLVPRSELVAVDVALKMSAFPGSVENAQKQTAAWLG